MFIHSNFHYQETMICKPEVKISNCKRKENVQWILGPLLHNFFSSEEDELELFSIFVRSPCNALGVEQPKGL